MKTHTTQYRVPYALTLGILLITGCATATEDMFASSVGVVPNEEEDAPSSSTDDIFVAENTEAKTFQEGRAALSLPGSENTSSADEEKKKNPPQVDNTPAPNQDSLNLVDPIVTSKPLHTVIKTPIKLSQLYFDEVVSRNQDDDLPQILKAHYTGKNTNFSGNNLGFVPQPSKLEKLEVLAVSTNQSVSGGKLPVMFVPFAVMIIVLIIAGSVLLYKFEVQRIATLERNEMAKKNLWNRQN